VKQVLTKMKRSIQRSSPHFGSHACTVYLVTSMTSISVTPSPIRSPLFSPIKKTMNEAAVKMTTGTMKPSV